MTIAGKTITRVDQGLSNDTLLVHFTDGTALEVRGHSYEEVDLDWDLIDTGTVKRYARAMQGRREARRIARLQREEYAALAPEVKEARRAARRAKMSPFTLAVEDSISSMYAEMVANMNHQVFSNSFTIPVAQNKKTRARRS